MRGQGETLMLTKDIAYSSGGRNLSGYLADDESRGKNRPGVLATRAVG